MQFILLENMKTFRALQKYQAVTDLHWNHFKQERVGDEKLQALAPSASLPNWAWYMPNQGQGGSGGGVGGTATQVQPLSTAASSGFSSFSTATASSTSYPFTNLTNDNFHNKCRGTWHPYNAAFES